MDYSLACRILDGLPPSSYNLDVVSELVAQMRLPLNSLKVIHIVGTNGKGSVSAMTRSALTACGYKTGCFNSPCVFDRRESIILNNNPIDEIRYVKAFNAAYSAIDAVEVKCGRKPTAFETETAMALYTFIAEGCDFAVIEAGLGGKDDATNIVSNTVVAAFTSISLDHTAILGDSLQAIAINKAGIIKRGCTVVSAPQPQEVIDVISAAAASCESDFTVCNVGRVIDFSIDGQSVEVDGTIYRIPLIGTYQAQNLGLALGILGALNLRGYDLPEDKIKLSLAHISWRGRMQIIGHNPLFVLDGAHNPAAAQALADSIDMYLGGRVTLLMGVFKDKDYKAELDILLNKADRIIAFDWDNPRALCGKELIATCGKADIDKHYVPDMRDAIRLAIELSGSSGAIVATGSLSHLKYVEEAYHSLW
ncbi:MAG: hypothetical protein K2M44_07515 [Clostridia bacterium]|nr:hypothetical protein [Clostridia bacterium]